MWVWWSVRVLRTTAVFASALLIDVASAHPHPHPNPSFAIFTTSKQSSNFVQFGLGTNSFGFYPETIAQSIGKLVTLLFHGDGHTATTEATVRMRDPCNTEGGFDKGVEYDVGEGSIIISTGNSICVFW